MGSWRRALSLPLVVCLVAGSAACLGGSAPPLDRLVIAAGSAGDVQHALGAGLARAARAGGINRVEVMTTAGTVDNLRLVAEGRADVGFSTVDTTVLARQGDQPFAGALPVLALAGLYDDYLQVVVRADSGIRDLAGLRGARVSTGPAGSAVDIVADRLLRTAGLDPDRDLRRSRSGSATAGTALVAGRIDALVISGGLPTPTVDDLARRTPIRLLPIGGPATQLPDRFGEYYALRSIPAGMYGLDAEVPTLGIRTVLVVHQQLSPRTAQELTRLLFAARPELVAAHGEARRLDERSGLATFPVPLHPGAARYYRQSKLLALPPRPG